MLISKIKSRLFLLTITCCLPHLNHAYEAPGEPQDFTQVAKEAIPAVVSIKVETKRHLIKKEVNKSDPWSDEDEDTAELWQRFFGQSPHRKYSEPSVAQGSGFLVSSDGYVLTNSHVVQGVDLIKVTLNDGTEMLGKLIGQDTNSDVALIKIDGKNLPFLKLGNSDTVEVAQPVMAIGTPAGLQATVTVGVISAKRRNNLDLARIEDFIQTDAAINRGNSGGPLLNLKGEVIGLNTAVASSMAGYMGIGFAVPSNIALNVKDQLLTSGSIKRSFIGVELQPMNANLAESFGLPKTEGVLVTKVLKGSPADTAKLKQGDIITELNGTLVVNSGSLRTAIALLPPNSKLQLTVLREGKSLKIIVVTKEFADSLQIE